MISGTSVCRVELVFSRSFCAHLARRREDLNSTAAAVVAQNAPASHCLCTSAAGSGGGFVHARNFSKLTNIEDDDDVLHILPTNRRLRAQFTQTRVRVKTAYISVRCVCVRWRACRSSACARIFRFRSQFFGVNVKRCSSASACGCA